jgi:hypothetical protein
VPIAELSDQPHYEVRTAELAVAGENAVHLWYVHAYAAGEIDLIAVTNL